MLRNSAWRCYRVLSRESANISTQTMARNKGPRRPPAQKKPPLTHFLCIPLVTPTSKSQLESSVARFTHEVTPSDVQLDQKPATPAEEPQETVLRTIPSKAIRPVGSLHCTLGVMSLDESRLSEAVSCLQGSEVGDLLADMRIELSEFDGSTGVVSSQPRESLEKGQQSTPPLIIDMTGLVSMHIAHKTSILYCAPYDSSGRLFPVCLALQKIFKDKDLLVDENRDLKLHATIVNTIYAKGSRSKGHGPNASAPLKIDATGILDKYKDFVWAENVVLDRVAICEMGVKKVFNDEGEEVGAEYTEVATVSLPN